MKRIRYECDTCGKDEKVEFRMDEAVPRRIRCTRCGKDDGMEKQMPRPAIHFHPSRGKK